jgi:hypothetical protein
MSQNADYASSEESYKDPDCTCWPDDIDRFCPIHGHLRDRDRTHIDSSGASS